PTAFIVRSPRTTNATAAPQRRRDAENGEDSGNGSTGPWQFPFAPRRSLRSSAPLRLCGEWPCSSSSRPFLLDLAQHVRRTAPHGLQDAADVLADQAEGD